MLTKCLDPVRRWLHRCPGGDACDVRPVVWLGELDANAIVGKRLERRNASRLDERRGFGACQPLGAARRWREHYDERTRRLVARLARLGPQLDGDAVHGVEAANPQHVAVLAQSLLIALRADKQKAIVRQIRQ